MKSAEFIQMVREDIAKCEKALETGQEIRSVLNELVGKYSKVSNNFPSIDMNQLLFRMHPNLPQEYVQSICGFLKAYALNNCEDYGFDNTNDTQNNGINVITNISNSNENNVKIDCFLEAKSKAENMTSLQDSEIEEILTKIDELREIVNSNDRKSKKWEKAKGVIKWVADKGVDVGLTLLPLIIKIGQ